MQRSAKPWRRMAAWIAAGKPDAAYDLYVVGQLVPKKLEQVFEAQHALAAEG